MSEGLLVKDALDWIGAISERVFWRVVATQLDWCAVKYYVLFFRKGSRVFRVLLFAGSIILTSTRR